METLFWKKTVMLYSVQNILSQIDTIDIVTQAGANEHMMSNVFVYPGEQFYDNCYLALISDNKCLIHKTAAPRKMKNLTESLDKQSPLSATLT